MEKGTNRGRLTLACQTVVLAVLAFFAQMVMAQPTCWPSNLGGEGTKSVFKVTEKGTFLGWWCPDLTTWNYVYAIGLPGYSLQHPAKVPSDFAKAAEAYWRANVAFTGAQSGADPRYREVFVAAAPEMTALRPADPVWKVAALASGTRPTYKVDKLKLIENPSQRATVGNLCDCKTLSLVQGSSTYCEPTPLKGVVALCRKE